jgi:hypothetical protein
MNKIIFAAACLSLGPLVAHAAASGSHTAVSGSNAAYVHNTQGAGSQAGGTTTYYSSRQPAQKYPVPTT